MFSQGWFRRAATISLHYSKHHYPLVSVDAGSILCRATFFQLDFSRPGMTPAEPTYFYLSFLYYPFFSLYHFSPAFFPFSFSYSFAFFFLPLFSFLSFLPFWFPFISLLFSLPFLFFLSSFFYSPGFFLFSPHPFHLVSRAPDSQERVWYFTVEQFVPVPQDNWGC